MQINEPKYQEAWDESLKKHLATESLRRFNYLPFAKACLLSMDTMLIYKDLEREMLEAADADDYKEMRKIIKGYVGRLSVNKNIPFKFRCNALEHFQKELRYLDAETAAQLFNSWEVAVDISRDKARSDSLNHYMALGRALFGTLDTISWIGRFRIEKNAELDIVTMRSLLAHVRLSCLLLPKLKTDEVLYKKLLHITGTHILLRRIDLFSKSRALKIYILDVLSNFVSMPTPVVLFSNIPVADLTGNRFIVLDTSQHPPIQAEALNIIPETVYADTVVLPIEEFERSLIHKIQLLNAGIMQHGNETYSANEARAIRMGGKSILQDLRHSGRAERKDQRRSLLRGNVILEWNLHQAFIDVPKDAYVTNYEYAPSTTSNRKFWSVVDISDSGAQLEYLGNDPNIMDAVGKLVGLNWLSHNDKPKLAIVRWVRKRKLEGFRTGVAFVNDDLSLRDAINVHLTRGHQTKTWPVLFSKSNGRLIHVWLPVGRMIKGGKFIIFEGHHKLYYQIIKVLQSGSNYIMGLARPYIPKEPKK
ncbi:MAG: hypothetical protein R8K21_02130 [Mariprofundales bacterium]